MTEVPIRKDRLVREKRTHLSKKFLCDTGTFVKKKDVKRQVNLNILC